MADQRDHVGQQIDAASRIYDDLEVEAHRLSVTDGQILHMVLMTWIDRRADEGLVSREDPRVDQVTKALAGMEGEAEAKRVSGG